MYRLIEITNNNKVITEGSFYKCLGKFQSICGLSFENHKEYSYTHYDIIEVNE